VVDLRASGVTLRRRGRVVLRAVDLHARAGRLTAILGPNGAGKSSLLRCLGALLPFEGQVRAGDAEVRRMDARRRARTLAFVPQRSELRAALGVREVVAQGRFAHGGGGHEAIERALEEAGATALAGRRFTALSVGEQQRVLLARALATEAPVLLLDEPTAALDVHHALKTFALLQRLAAAGRTLVTVVHDLAFARRFADDALLLAEGEVVCAGAVEEVVAPGPVGEVYGVAMQEAAEVRFEELTP